MPYQSCLGLRRSPQPGKAPCKLCWLLCLLQRCPLHSTRPWTWLTPAVLLLPPAATVDDSVNKTVNLASAATYEGTSCFWVVVNRYRRWSLLISDDKEVRAWITRGDDTGCSRRPCSDLRRTRRQRAVYSRFQLAVGFTPLLLATK